MEPCNTGSSAEISPIQGQGTLMSQNKLVPKQANHSGDSQQDRRLLSPFPTSSLAVPRHAGFENGQGGNEMQTSP